MAVWHAELLMAEIAPPRMPNGRLARRIANGGARWPEISQWPFGMSGRQWRRVVAANQPMDVWHAMQPMAVWHDAKQSAKWGILVRDGAATENEII